MRSRLFWKIFIAFWITTIVINQLSWAIYLATADPWPSWDRVLREEAAPVHLAAARAVAETGGWPAVETFLDALPLETRERIRVDPEARPGPDVRIATALLPGGAPLTLVYDLGAPEIQHYSLGDILSRSWDNLVASVLCGLLFAAGLAWYLTRPIRRVRDGFEALAGGDLSTRLAPGMGRRRDEFADLARDFDRMAARLQQLLAMRDQLLHDVSHELRSPLARTTLALGLHEQGRASTDVVLARIAAELRRLDELVGEVLSLARAEGGAGDAERYFDLAGLVEAVAATARFEAQASGIEVRMVSGPRDALVRGSPELMRRALENVLRNAIRVSREGDVLLLTVCPVSERRVIEVTVADQGPGVGDDQLEAMFDPFTRIDGGMGSGFGLGLAIARRAVAAMGGTIAASNRSTPDHSGRAQGRRGLAVTISLPLADALPDED